MRQSLAALAKQHQLPLTPTLPLLSCIFALLPYATTHNALVLDAVQINYGKCGDKRRESVLINNIMLT
jgi:hypothetical protein